MSRLTDEITQTFDLEKLRRDAAHILNEREWPDLQKVIRDHQAQRRFAKRAYELDYEERITMARVRLINQAGAKDRAFTPKWFGHDRFDKEAIDRQAHQVVHHAYLNEQVRIDQNEAKALTQLIESSDHARAKREKPRRDFARATDRRSGLERRTRSRD